MHMNMSEPTHLRWQHVKATVGEVNLVCVFVAEVNQRTVTVHLQDLAVDYIKEKIGDILKWR